MKINFWIVLFIFIVAFGIVYAIAMSIRKKNTNIYDAVPVSAALILETKQPALLWKTISNETAFWPALIEIDYFSSMFQHLKMLDTMLSTGSAHQQRALAESEMAIAMHKSNDNYEFIFIVRVGSDLRMHQLQEMISKTFGYRISTVERSYKGYQTAMLVDKQQGWTFNYCINNGLFIGSFDKSLLELALRTHNSKQSLMKDERFVKARNTVGNGVPAHLYIQSAQFAEVVQRNAEPMYKTVAFQAVEKASGWTALDLTVKNDALLMNGFAFPLQEGFMAALKNQTPVEQALFKVLPHNTRLLLHFGLSDFTLFHKQTMGESVTQLLNGKYNIDLNAHLIQQIQGEVALSFLSDDVSEGVFFAAKLKNSKVVSALFNRLVEATNGQSSWDKTPIGWINFNGLVPVIFGNSFAAIANTFYVIVDDYLLIANNPNVLTEITKHYNIGRTLANNDNFKRFANNLSEVSNVILYANVRNGFDLLSRFVDNKLRYQMNRNQKVVNEFEAFAMQLSAMDQLIYSNFVFKYNPDYKEKSTIVWSLQLDAPIVSKPSIVKDQKTDKKNVIVFDVQNRMYLIDASGQLIWKKQLKEQPMSEVVEVELFPNGKSLYLFNSEHYLHLIDRNGQYANNFPVRLGASATNSISVTSDINKRKTHVFVSCSDKITYCYDLSGREAISWEKPTSSDIVTKPVELLSGGGQQYCIITDASGDVKILNEYGSTQINISSSFNKAVNTDFFINKTNSKGILLATSSSGALTYISGSNIVSSAELGYFSPDHFFLYDDFTQNKSNDFIFLDANHLQIFDRFNKPIFSHQFKNPILTKPVFYNIKPGFNVLAIWDQEAKEMYLIDKDGKIIIGVGLLGDTPFAVASLHANNEIHLISSIGPTVINYQIY